MSTKIELLYEKIFLNFTTGIYGIPKIPTERDIAKKIEEITKDDDDPITKNVMLQDVFIDEIHDTFADVIDDLDVLYSSIESQSINILEQLTNSLKEHNGVKRELRNIKTKALDIQAGKLGKNYLQYVHTENFISMDNLNVAKTTSDPDTKSPVVDIKSGTMYIPNVLSNLVDLSHYYQRKLDVVNTEFVGSIKEAGYVGAADANIMFDVSDDRRLVYRVQTDLPSEMKTSFVIQLDPNRKSIEVNGIAINLDADNTVGFLRVQYKKDTGWESIPEIPVSEITTDRILLRFENIDTTHLKFQFIKETPDILDSNEYYVVINDLSIFHALTYKSSTYHSKSIKIEPYNNEDPVIGNVAVETKGYIPEGCTADVYVAKDKIIRGYFTNVNDEYVLPTSAHVYKFVEDEDETYPPRHVLLSDIYDNLEAQDIDPYRNLDYDWQLVKSFSNADSIKPALIQFIGSVDKIPSDNRLYNEINVVFGDLAYTGEYPQNPHPDNPDDWFLSGLIDPSNPYWVSYMSELVASGYIADSGTYGDPTGYPFNYYDYNSLSYLKWGEIIESLDGWYRPSVDIVTPSGYNEVIHGKVTDNVPDYYFNGLRFYHIYKFALDSKVVASTIKLYTYQTGPNTGTRQSYVPSNGVWTYNTKDVIKTLEYSTANSNPFTDAEPLGPPGSGAIMIPIPSGDMFVQDSVKNLHYTGYNNVLQRGTHYDLVLDYSLNWWVDMFKSSTTEAYSPLQNVEFTYSYRTEDRYASYWEGYIIADIAGTLTVQQLIDSDGNNVVNRILIEDTEGIPVYNEIMDDVTEVVPIPKGVYKYKFFCLTDNYTKYAKDNWSPYDTIYVKTSQDMKLVSKIEPLNIVDFDILLHSTSYERDNRASLVDRRDGKYLVVKEPSLNIMQGYYFHAGKSMYQSIPAYKSRNIGHYQRKFLQRVGATGYYLEEYITGSSGNIVNSTVGSHYATMSGYQQDLTWNDGILYPEDFANTDQDKQYAQHSSYGYSLHIDDITTEDRGHLFYNTGENLCDFYTITYGEVDTEDPTVDRFLYKIELNSEHKINTPILESVKFTMNVMEEEYEN